MELLTERELLDLQRNMSADEGFYEAETFERVGRAATPESLHQSFFERR
jgi:hypothetical protein